MPSTLEPATGGSARISDGVSSACRAAASVLPEGDQDVLATFATNVTRKLALLRLAAMPTEGSA